MKTNPSRDLTIFNEALEIAAMQDRVAYLDRACGNNAALRHKIDSLLAAYERCTETPSELNEKIATRLFAVPQNLEGAGTQIGRYKLLQQIGEGGFGVVYMAEQKEPVKRRVALKIIKLGMDTKQVAARFDAERQALAMMDHPNIAKVLDGGATEGGRPYFVMELVKGVSVTKFCDENILSTKERLELFTTVCNAVQHAHQKGIIHRDIKPSNILVTLHDGKPVPKVIDFGIAKATQQELTERTIFTQFQQMIGTPAYMSPEQAEMSGLDIDTRTDIYSLGVLLYELLTGETPLNAKSLLGGGYDEIRRRIKEEEPLRPSTRVSTMTGDELTSNAEHRNLNPKYFAAELRGDLDWIVMKALEKDRTRRYESATGFAQDIRRFLQSEPVVARPPSATYRFQKLVRRNRLAFAAATTVATALVLGMVVSIWQARRAIRAEHTQRALRQEADQQRNAAVAAHAGELKQRRLAEQTARDLRQHLYVADMGKAYHAINEGNLELTKTLVEKYRHWRQGEEDLRGFEWRYLWQACQPSEHQILTRAGQVLRCAVFSPNGKILALGGDPTNVSILDVRSKAVLTNFTGFDGPIDLQGLTFSRDGRFFAAKGGHVIRVWNTADWQPVICSTSGLPNQFQNGNDAVVISPDSAMLATRIEGGIGFWDLASGKQLERHVAAEIDYLGRVLTYSRDGTVLAVSEEDPGLQIREARSLNVITNLIPDERGPASFGRVTSVAFSTNLVAAGYRNGQLMLWETQTWHEVARLDAHASYLMALDFSPDGQLLATGGSDQMLYLWKVAELLNRRLDSDMPQPYATLKGHRRGLASVMFSPDGQTLASSAWDGTARLWIVPPATEPAVLTNIFQLMSKVVMWVSSDGGRVIFVNHNKFYASEAFGTVGPMALPFPPLGTDGEHAASAAISPDGNALALARTNRIELWDLGAITPRAIFPPERPAEQIEFSSDGKLLITAHDGGGIKIRNLTRSQREVLLKDDVSPFALSPDGTLIAAYRRDREGIDLWSLAEGRSLGSLPVRTGEYETMLFSPDSKLLAQATRTIRNSVLLWDVASRHCTQMQANEATGIIHIAFAPDGKTLIFSTFDNVLSFWNTVTGEEIFRDLTASCPGGHDFVFSKNGECLVGRGKTLPDGNGPLLIWRAPSFARIDAIGQASANEDSSPAQEDAK